MMSELTLKDRMKHFEESESKLGNGYGAEILHNAIIEIEQLQKDSDKLVEGLRDLINDIGGGKKACGHDFTCSCAFDNAKALINSIGEDE